MQQEILITSVMQVIAEDQRKSKKKKKEKRVVKISGSYNKILAFVYGKHSYSKPIFSSLTHRPPKAWVSYFLPTGD